MEDAQDELLAGTDEDYSSENEDQCLSTSKHVSDHRQPFFYVDHSKTQFLCVKTLLLVSTISILILLPLYMETINVTGDVYGLILTNTTFSTVVLILLVIGLKIAYSKYAQIKILSPPIKIRKLLVIAFIYFACGFLFVYALDRKRVVCHLQDPLKGLVLVWSFFYYFFFCQRPMTLQRIFSVTVIIVGLFVAVDYSMCNEFRCRGYERQRISDDRGEWSWKTHAIWTAVYIMGLALWAAYFTVLERLLVTSTDVEHQISSSSVVNTVSSSVATASSSSLTRDTREDSQLLKRISTVHLALWLHVCGLFLVFALFWTDFIPQLGKGSNGSTFWNQTINGIRCHFVTNQADCNGLSSFSWLFLFAYLAFLISSLKFLVLTQSAVYTVATIATALPLTNIWWSLFQLNPTHPGLLVWSPQFGGELISALIGLPVIFVGLYFLYQAHCRDCYRSRALSNHSFTVSHLS